MLNTFLNDKEIFVVPPLFKIIIKLKGLVFFWVSEIIKGLWKISNK